MPDIITIAGATGSVADSDGRALGKIGTLAAAAVLLFKVPVSDRTERVRVWPKCSLAHTVQAYLGESDALFTGTITLTDATAVDDGDTFWFMGLPFTAEATEGDASAAARKWYHPAQAAGAVNLCALLNDAVYGVPGYTFSVAAVSTTDVISFVSTKATALHYALAANGAGTQAADANEIAIASTSLLNLRPEGSLDTFTAGSTTTKGKGKEVWNDGHVPYFALTNTHSTDPATIVVEAARYAAS